VASQLIGRTDCPECKFGSAHVKQSEKCLYRHCPECGATYHTHGTRQRDDLQAKTRPLQAGAAPGATQATTAPPKAPDGTAAPAGAPPKAPAKRSGLFAF
jgi:predicted  nucleic acid-binding Zn-ribbon protein